MFNIHGFWELIFDGQYATVPQDQALFYLVCLLTQPHAPPLSALELGELADFRFGRHPDFRPSLEGPRFRPAGPELVRLLRHKQTVLEAILDNPDEPEQIKDEALRELSVVYDLQQGRFEPSAYTAQGTDRIVGLGLRRLHARLSRARDVLGRPHPVLRPFAEHILAYLLVASLRSSGGNCLRRFVYEPPIGVIWDDGNVGLQDYETTGLRDY